MWCHQGTTLKYSLKLTSAQTRACQELLGKLVISSDHHLIDEDLMMLLDDEEWQNYLENCSGLSEDSDDEVFESCDAYSAADEVVSTNDGLREVSWDFVAETPMQVQILELLIALYTHLPVGGDDKFFSPILHFLVLFSRKKTGQWALP